MPRCDSGSARALHEVDRCVQSLAVAILAAIVLRDLAGSNLSTFVLLEPQLKCTTALLLLFLASAHFSLEVSLPWESSLWPVPQAFVPAPLFVLRRAILQEQKQIHPHVHIDRED